MANKPNGNPLVVSKSAGARALQRRDLSGSTGSEKYDEAYIQTLAFEHPEILPIEEIDRAYSRPIPVCMELSTPVGYVDTLYVTPTGRLVIVEAKLWRNPEARRKVIAQILEYAGALATWDYEDLQREVSRRTGRKGNVLYELTSAAGASIGEADFVDEVQKCLRRGQFLLLILGDGIKEGAATITSFLEKYGSLDFTFGLVELELYDLDEDELLVLPRIITKTVIINRKVVTAAEGLVVTEEGETIDDAIKGELTESQRFYRAFWLEFTSSLQLDDPGQPVPKTTKIENLYFALPPSGGTTWVSAFFSKSKRRVGVYLTFIRGSFGDVAYERLLEEQNIINQELGDGIIWDSTGDKHKIVVRQEFEDLWSPKNRDDIKRFFSENVNRFVNTFRPRLEKIVADYE